MDRKFVHKIESKLYKNDGLVVLLEDVALDMVSWWTLGPGSIAFDE